MYETSGAIAGRYASAPRMGGRNHHPVPDARSMTPSGRGGTTAVQAGGLIRLTLKKPMGIVFEPTYDSNNKSQQRGVRICDLPRTGAAALSRQLQVGDELLQINNTVVSRLVFDEIMELIIEADPDAVHLLFRRPKKESLQRTNPKLKEDRSSTVKWVDEEEKTKKKKKKKKQTSSPKKKPIEEEEEEETLQSKSTLGTDSYVKKRKTKKSRRKVPYESESFLDMLIDAVCSENTCRDSMRRDDFSDDDSETYATYEEAARKHEQQAKKYEDDGTLESVDTRDRPPVLGLAPNPQPAIVEEDNDSGNPAPIKELEYNDDVADVSVMESLGGPSLLLEKQRAAQMARQQQPVVPDAIIRDYGHDYALPGMTRLESIQADPAAFYSHIVRQLLQQHEPEKVRLLDKLLSKYKGREDNLVQKLSVRYQVPPEEEPAPTPEVVEPPVVQPEEVPEDEEPPITPPPVKEDTPMDEPSEYSATDNEDSVDGTSPAVIAQVSELLNYVYGKTTVPGQIDRVSTIMRAYEGREAVLLELLETKALIKANKEKENADNLPSFLRNSQLPMDEMDEASTPKDKEAPQTSLKNSGGTVIHDDISSMSGVSSPAVDLKQHQLQQPQNAESSPKTSATPRKKKGLFGGLFKKKPNPGRKPVKKADASI